jgi:hypothetical protein
MPDTSPINNNAPPAGTNPNTHHFLTPISKARHPMDRAQAEF